MLLNSKTQVESITGKIMKELLMIILVTLVISNTNCQPTTCEPCKCFHNNRTLEMSCSNVGPKDINWNVVPRLTLFVDLENISDFAFNHFPANWRILIAELNVAGGDLQDIDLSGFNKIEKLRIYNSKIVNAQAAYIPNSIKVLSITNSGLNELLIPYEHNVEVLDLSGNRLETIPVTNNVEHLNVSRNSLFGVKYSICNKAKRLSVIDLSHNQISDLQQNGFQCLIPEGSSQALTINLDHNLVRTVDERAFAGLLIKKIRLDNNNLNSIPKNLLDWNRVEYIDLQHNPWDCECSKQWMLDLLVPALYKKSSPLTLMELRCASPNKFKNKQFAFWLNRSTDVFCGADYLTLDGSPLKNSENEIFWTGSMVATVFLSCLITILFITIIIVWVWPNKKRIIRRQPDNETRYSLVKHMENDKTMYE